VRKMARLAERIQAFFRDNEVYERNFEVGGFFGGLQIYSYQLALGLSISRLRCNGTRLLRGYLGPFKLWVNTRKKDVNDTAE